ncbi:MAG: helix-turn-helix domain-containing protein [Anaerolineales bacterium]|jgi:hypothetical protein
MSVKIMGLVWDSQLPRDARFILLAYADHADHNGGSIYPAVKTISRKTGYSTRSVQTITKKLARAGILIEDGRGPKGTNRWRINPEKLKNFTPPAKSAPRKKSRQTPAKFAPEPSLKHQKEDDDRESPNFGDVIKTYESLSGTINGYIADELKSSLDDWEKHRSTLSRNHTDKNKNAFNVLILAIQQMGRHTNTPNLAYLDRILQNWMQHGILAEKPNKKMKVKKPPSTPANSRFAEYLNNPDYLDENGEPEWNDIYADYFRKAKAGRGENKQEEALETQSQK